MMMMHPSLLGAPIHRLPVNDAGHGSSRLSLSTPYGPLQRCRSAHARTTDAPSDCSYSASRFNFLFFLFFFKVVSLMVCKNYRA